MLKCYQLIIWPTLWWDTWPVLGARVLATCHVRGGGQGGKRSRDLDTGLSLVEGSNTGLWLVKRSKHAASVLRKETTKYDGFSDDQIKVGCDQKNTRWCRNAGTCIVVTWLKCLFSLHYSQCWFRRLLIRDIWVLERVNRPWMELSILINRKQRNYLQKDFMWPRFWRKFNFHHCIPVR